LAITEYRLTIYNPENVQHRNYEPIDIWESKYSSMYYGCSGRSADFRC